MHGLFCAINSKGKRTKKITGLGRAANPMKISQGGTYTERRICGGCSVDVSHLTRIYLDGM